MPRNNNIQLRRGTYSEWDANSSGVLNSGEPGFVTNFNIVKIGDGVTQWSDLPALNDNLRTIVRNDTGSTINKMSVVYINGAQGDTPRISLGIASGEAGSSKTYGIVTSNISTGGIGTVVVDGTLKNLDTLTGFSGVSEGTALWLSPTVSGGITITKPYAPYHAVFVGTLIRVHQTQGVINVKMQNGYELEELHNVATTGATNGQFLQYNSGSGLWFPSSSGNFTSLSVNGSGVSISGHNHTVSDITNFNSSVSGLLPTIANSGDNRILTSTGSSTGINAEANATFDGTNFNVSGVMNVDNLRLDGNTLSSSSGNIIVNPSGAGALQRDSGGNARGQYAVDWQTIRSTGTMVAAGNYSVIGGGNFNTANGNYSAVGGGLSNISSATHSIVGGGYENSASGNKSTIGGGWRNTSSGSSSTIGGGGFNTSSGENSTVGGGYNNTSSGYNSTVGGGSYNSSSAFASTVGGGFLNTSSASYSTVSGGKANTSSGGSSTISGGGNNSSSGYYSTVGGGNTNTSSGSYGTVGGGKSNTSSGSYGTVGGGKYNTCSTNYSTIGGGYGNVHSSGVESTIGGGRSNAIYNNRCTIGGGYLNVARAVNSTIGGGYANTITASGLGGTIGGGSNIIIDVISAAVGGGYNNTASGKYSTIPGGIRAKTNKYGELSHAAGYFETIGDAQHSVLIARRSTTDATANVVLTLDGATPGATNRLTLPASTTWAFSIKLSAYNSTDNAGGWWMIRGGIRRNNSNNTALIGSLITESGADSSLSSTSVNVVADDTNEALEIRVTGISGKTIRWVAVVDLSQVSFGTP